MGGNMAGRPMLRWHRRDSKTFTYIVERGCSRQELISWHLICYLLGSQRKVICYRLVTIQN